MTRHSSHIFSIFRSAALAVVFLAGLIVLMTLTRMAATAEVSNTKTAAGITESVQFLSAVNYFSGGPESSIVILADINGDGVPDAIVGNEGGQSVTVFLGRGDGVFEKLVTYNTAVISIVAADVNGDHKLDLVIGAGNSVAVMLGNGDGTFQPAASFDSGNDVRSLAVADVNKDGNLDVITASFNSGTIGVLLGNGNGTFQSVATYPTNAASLLAIAVADFNGDSKPDLVISAFPAAPFGGGVMLGNGNGTFQPPIGGLAGAALAVADLNGDGKMDVVVGTGQGAFGFSTLMGKGDGTFTAGGSYSERVTQFAIADVNGDGNLDVLFSDYYSSEADVMLGNGDGTLQSATILKPKRYGPGGIAVGDVDGNGKPDILLADWSESRFNSHGGFLTVLLNDSGSTSNTVVATSGTPSHIQQPVTFTATVSANGVPAPDGDLVRFYKKGTLLGTAPLSGGTAALTTKLSVGTYEIKATYNGNKTLQQSSATVQQVVEKP